MRLASCRFTSAFALCLTLIGCGDDSVPPGMADSAASIDGATLSDAAQLADAGQGSETTGIPDATLGSEAATSDAAQGVDTTNPDAPSASDVTSGDATDRDAMRGDAGLCVPDSGPPVVPVGAAQIVLPGTPPGIRFDDMRFSARLQALVIPAGHTGNVDLVDITTHAITALPGFTASSCVDGTGSTSAEEGGGLVYAIDKTAMRLDVADPVSKTIVGFTPLAASPDVVRFVAPTREVWVTEASATPPQIEVFSLAAPKSPVSTGTIQVAGGVELLEIDATNRRAYTQSGATTMGLDLQTHAVVASWSNMCGAGGAHGLAIDAARGLLILVCSSGNVVTLRLTDGTLLASEPSTATGVDLTAYDPKLAHFYVAGRTSQTLAVVGVGDLGSLQVLGSFPTVSGARCVVSDLNGSAYVCDPNSGSILAYTDTFPMGAPDAGPALSDAGSTATDAAGQ
jgi:hypothetical protein